MRPEVNLNSSSDLIHVRKLSAFCPYFCLIEIPYKKRNMLVIRLLSINKVTKEARQRDSFAFTKYIPIFFHYMYLKAKQKPLR